MSFTVFKGNAEQLAFLDALRPFLSRWQLFTDLALASEHWSKQP